MDIRIIDRARNVTVVPTKNIEGRPPFEVMDELYRQHEATVHTGMVEFECDRAWAEAMQRAAIEDPHTIVAVAPPDTPPYSYRGVPIIVTGEEQPA